MRDALVILVPVLRRPHRVAPLLKSIRDTTPDPYRVLFIADPGDEEELAAVKQHLRRDRVGLMVLAGNYARKINYAVSHTHEPLIFLGADDLNFYPGWLAKAVKRLTGDIGVVGTNDLCNQRVIEGRHSTHSLVARPYVARGTVDDPSKLLHEGYLHEFVDDEFVETAKARGAFAMALDSVVEHLHPQCGKAETDSLYDGQHARMRHGRRLYRRRRCLWMSPSA